MQLPADQAVLRAAIMAPAFGSCQLAMTQLPEWWLRGSHRLGVLQQQPVHVALDAFCTQVALHKCVCILNNALRFVIMVDCPLDLHAYTYNDAAVKSCTCRELKPSSHADTDTTGSGQNCVGPAVVPLQRCGGHHELQAGGYLHCSWPVL